MQYFTGGVSGSQLEANVALVEVEVASISRLSS